MSEARKERIAAFASWVRDNITGDEKGQLQTFLHQLFQASGQRGCREAGGKPISNEDAGSTAFAHYVWTFIVPVEMKNRIDLARHSRQVFDGWQLFDTSSRCSRLRISI